MIEITQVATRRQQREFLNFPLRLYRDNPCFAPPLYAGEKKIFDPSYPYYEVCEAVCYLAGKDGKTVGRISGILQKTSNELRNQKRVRFTRFDCIDDAEVAKALFDAVEKWAAEKGMNEVCGPLGFSNFERQGLLIEGFDRLSTFEEQYNAPYYARLLEQCGYTKEVDWLERKVTLPEDGGERLHRMRKLIEKRYHFRRMPVKNVRELSDKVGDAFLDLYEKCYTSLYGTVTLSEGVRKMLLRMFRLVLNRKYVGVAVNEEGKIAAFGIAFPSIAKALQPSGGKLTPAAAVRVLRAAKKPEFLELGLVGVDPAFRTQGAVILVVDAVAELLSGENAIAYAETNMCLEDNFEIQNLWDNNFHTEIIKRRRAYVKALNACAEADGVTEP